MKHRISYTEYDRKYKIESKSVFGNWQTRNNYFYTDDTGNLINSTGFNTYDKAEEWLLDRYPKLKIDRDLHVNKDISFEF